MMENEDNWIYERIYMEFRVFFPDPRVSGIAFSNTTAGARGRGAVLRCTFRTVAHALAPGVCRVASNGGFHRVCLWLWLWLWSWP